MAPDRRGLYRFPWSKTDNPGGWIEVTDACDLACPGCYRHRLEGHRRLEDVCEEILACRRMTNCDRIGIAGGEPLLYPELLEVVDFIARNGMKPMLLTNGQRLTEAFGRELKKAGLVKFHFHVDCGMMRPGWKEKTEAEMNELRQEFADLVFSLGGMQCGYNITVFPHTVSYLPDIISWCRRNLHKVQHVSLVAFRSIPLTDAWEYRVGGKVVDAGVFQHSSQDLAALSLTTDRMFEVISGRVSDFRPSAYLPGTAIPETYKFLVTTQVGSAHAFYGCLGPRTVEIVQVFHHFFKGRYFDFLRSPKAGKKLFLLAPFDRRLAGVMKNFLKRIFLRPLGLFEKVYVQTVSLQQPNELVDGKVNLCDGCMNMMVYCGELIPSCRLDEYRLLGGPMVPLKKGLS